MSHGSLSTQDYEGSHPAPDLIWSALTHTGRFRKNNEDAFLALAEHLPAEAA